MPWEWLLKAPAGKVIIDPTVAVSATEDVWLENTINQNNKSAGLLVGKAGGNKKRTLVRFDLAADIPANATVVSARPVG